MASFELPVLLITWTVRGSSDTGRTYKLHREKPRDRTCSRLAVPDSANHYPAFKSKQQSSCTVKRLSLSSFSSSVASALRRDFSCLGVTLYFLNICLFLQAALTEPRRSSLSRMHFCGFQLAGWPWRCCRRTRPLSPPTAPHQWPACLRCSSRSWPSSKTACSMREISTICGEASPRPAPTPISGCKETPNKQIPWINMLPLNIFIHL